MQPPLHMMILALLFMVNIEVYSCNTILEHERINDEIYERLIGNIDLKRDAPDSLPALLEKLLYTASHDASFPSAKHVCCTPRKWEANALLSSGNVYYDANTFFAYFNGSGKIVFDGVRKKSYLHFNLTEFTPLMPPPQHATRTVIKDYEKGVMYQISGDICDKQNITEDEINIVCIPGQAEVMSHGTFGTNTSVATYEFSTFDDQVLNRFTVAHTGTQLCEPVITSFSIIKQNPNTIYSLDVTDFHSGVSDPSIFTPPKSCDG